MIGDAGPLVVQRYPEHSEGVANWMWGGYTCSPGHFDAGHPSNAQARSDGADGHLGYDFKACRREVEVRQAAPITGAESVTEVREPGVVAEIEQSGHDWVAEPAKPRKRPVVRRL
jgi:hypothetical protein